MENRPLDPSPIQSVGIIGGGTAGYLTALTLRKKIPQLDITIIESPNIPTLKVGESTTDHILSLLHDTLEIDILEFFQKVRPNWKLGIRFYWGKSGDQYFNNGFVDKQIIEAFYLENDLNLNLSSILMDENKFYLSQTGQKDQPYKIPLSKGAAYGYQFENGAFINFLTEKAEEWGIKHKNAVIDKIILRDNGENVDYLITEEGQNLPYDFYIDCSGFRSILMEKTMGSRYIDFSNSFFTDTAVLGAVPQHGEIKPYTTTLTMDSGWQWITPLRHEDHIGYVFSSQFCSREQAADELKRKNPETGDPQFVSFKSGRHEHFWKGNVVAIGNAYGFLEPIQGVALQLMILQIKNLINHFPSHTYDSENRQKLNALIGAQWDYSKNVLASQFKFNKRINSPFWRHCQHETDLGFLEDYIDVFKENGPFSFMNSSLQNFMFPWEKTRSVLGNANLDLILMGIGNLRPKPISIKNPAQKRKELATQIKSWKAFSEQALPLGKAMQLIDTHPELIDWNSLKDCYRSLEITDKFQKQGLNN